MSDRHEHEWSQQLLGDSVRQKERIAELESSNTTLDILANSRQATIDQQDNRIAELEAKLAEERLRVKALQQKVKELEEASDG